MTEDMKIENVGKNGDNSEAADGPNLPEHKSWSDNKSSPDKKGVLDANGFLKRKASDDDDNGIAVTPAKKKKAGGPGQPKNPVQTLNEYKPGMNDKF